MVAVLFLAWALSEVRYAAHLGTLRLMTSVLSPHDMNPQMIGIVWQPATHSAA